MQKMDDLKACALVKRYGLKLPRQALARTPKQAVASARKIGYPVSLKVSSRDIVHKTEAGGLALNIKSDKEAEKAFERIMASCRKKAPKARIDGVLVQEHLDGHEVIVGSKIDQTFGPVIMFGLGGIFVEVLKDVSFRLAPITRQEAREMISEIKGYPLLKGARGRKPANLKALEDALMAVSRLVSKEKRVKELDINPLFVNERAAVASDVRILA
jgi:acyl-CoA synthetase (NDP forming)